MTSHRVLILGDSDNLSKAIAWNLRNVPGLEPLWLVAAPPNSLRSPAGQDTFDLIIVALSSPASEPVVFLARASLTDKIGRVPLLIISDRSFVADPEARMTHLSFPFAPADLCQTVVSILASDGPPGANEPVKAGAAV